MNNKEAVDALMAHRVRFADDFGWDKHTIEALDFAIASLINESSMREEGEGTQLNERIYEHNSDCLVDECGVIKLTNEKMIAFYPGNSTNPVIMTIDVPTDRDAEDYIDEFLDGILNEFLRYNCDWDFVRMMVIS